jgi:hypothetical protein
LRRLLKPPTSLFFSLRAAEHERESERPERKEKEDPAEIVEDGVAPQAGAEIDDHPHSDAEENMHEPYEERDIEHLHRLLERIDENELRKRRGEHLHFETEVAARHDPDDQREERTDEKHRGS